MGRKLSVLLFLLILSVPICLGAWSFNYFHKPGDLKSETKIIIPKGSSVKKIAYILNENNIIKYPEIFYYLVRLKYPDTKMKAGEYLFNAGTSPSSAFRKISSGDVVIRGVTIPEGLMTFQILEIIKNTDGLMGEVPEGIKEGELLPETYHFHYGDNRTKIISRMQTAMRNAINELWENRADNLPIKTKEELLILASIVEKETGIADERGQVASVFINRLNKRMRLQTDPTVIYSITKGEYVLERPLRYKDLEIQSPYNTYVNYGLPPAPIANPGKDSIAAVLNPPETNKLYFVADGTGGHKFSTSLREHNNNVRKWRKINRKARN